MNRLLVTLVITNIICSKIFCMEIMQYKPNTRAKISLEQERNDAARFITYLDIFKDIAREALAGEQTDNCPQISDNQRKWLKTCIQANQIMRYKVEENRGAVYRQICRLSPLYLDANVLEFWVRLAQKNKIDQKLFEKQHETLKKFLVFFEELEKEGLIGKYPRTISGKEIFKAAL